MTDYLHAPVCRLLTDLSSEQPVPAAGAAVATTAAMAAALTAKVARRSTRQRPDADRLAADGDRLRDALAPLAGRDCTAYTAAVRMVRDGDDRATAMRVASEPLRQILSGAAECAELAAGLAANGNPNLRADAAAAAVLAATAARLAADLIRVNLADLDPDTVHTEQQRADRAWDTAQGAQRNEKRSSLCNRCVSRFDYLGCASMTANTPGRPTGRVHRAASPKRSANTRNRRRTGTAVPAPSRIDTSPARRRGLTPSFES